MCSCMSRQSEVLAAVEGLASRGAETALPLAPSITAALAPALAGAAAGAADADTRFQALKLLLDLALPFLAEPVDPEGAAFCNGLDRSSRCP